MFEVLRSIVFVGMCIFVLTDNPGEPCIFDWESFEQSYNPGFDIDFSGQRITNLTENGVTYHYISGPINVRNRIDQSYRVFTLIDEISNGTKRIFGRSSWICDFYDEVYPTYLLPIAGTRNNFSFLDYDCPTFKGTIQVYPAKSSKELVSPSSLAVGKYRIFISFRKQIANRGSIRGVFNVLRK